MASLSISFSDWLAIFGVVFSLATAVFGAWLTIRYSSVYHEKREGKGCEKWVVSEKISHAVKKGRVESSRLSLAKSSFKNAGGFVDISIDDEDKDIQIDRYATIHSCIHNIISPGKLLLKNQNTWVESVSSNEFSYVIKYSTLQEIPIDIIDSKFRKNLGRCRAVGAEFEFAATYTGPRYKNRIVIFCKGIGIVASVVEYHNRDKDIYRLKKFYVKTKCDDWLPVSDVGNYWVYDIEFQYGPNVTNISE